MVRDTCETNDGHTGRSYLLVQRSPQMGQGALLPLEPQGTRSESELLTLQAALACHSYQPPELPDTHAPQEPLMNTGAVLLKGFNQLLEELATLLVPQLQDVAKGIHQRIDTTQSIQVPLSVGSCTAGHGAPSGKHHEAWLGRGSGVNKGGTAHDRAPEMTKGPERALCEVG
jgi:hypothetical protein